ncbi:uracil-DNA glycosylase [Streptomyces pluripotens]|uniref:Type-5 uracil-DNA glycosylase n=1 Tax=Streptomyces pluripotens TaxID=1355015 RepID=A0A221NVD3_9ACTN|nr:MULTISPECIES: uracil-DNA glycosylase [Streptomyces]ARP69707.1 uracil-DNA glycosylase [Streptomyces pluripotens]ASN23963.1 uracil-DNA glycosylase [Streptomyces pluripotens]KIE24167.1 uracil-DNA glycosylase [Streptomyces sp. MUSC 125]MCH0555855.1 uracil-DNA glycosylase [Streptomyces sp. MUM 16J]
MDHSSALARLDRHVAHCRACPRLVDWREETARTRRAAFADWTYWGRPVPGFGPADAPLVIIGLAPAAHGGNRTGRMFTGDRSGDLLYQALYDVGLASQPTSVSIDDGLRLHGVRVTAPVHCAPPANKPTPGERDTCRPWLVQELRLLRPALKAAVVLGAFGWQAALPALAEAGWAVPHPRPGFAHGTRVALHTLDGPETLDLFGCFHVSQRNTFTGRLTAEMLREVLRGAAHAAGLDNASGPG